MRNGQQPFHQGQPPVQVPLHVRVVVFEQHRLVIVGRRIPVVHQREVGGHPVAETLQLEVPVEPPAGVFPAEQDHQQRAEEEQPADRGGGRGAAVPIGPLPGATGDRTEYDGDGDEREDAECRGHPVEVAVRVINGELDRVCRLLRLPRCHISSFLPDPMIS